MVVGVWATRLISSIRLEVADIPIRFDFSFDWRVFSFGLAIALVTGLLVGLAPAWRAARSDFNKVLHEGSRGILGSGKSRVRKRAGGGAGGRLIDAAGGRRPVCSQQPER